MERPWVGGGLPAFRVGNSRRFGRRVANGRAVVPKFSSCMLPHPTTPCPPMKPSFAFRVLLVPVVSLVMTGCGPQPPADPVSAATDSGDFVGRWGLTLPFGAGWLEVHTEDGVPIANLLWHEGSVTPVSHAYFNDGVLTLTRIEPIRSGVPQADEGPERPRRFATDLFELRLLEGDRLAGTARFPDRAGSGLSVVEFEGFRIPPDPPAPDLAAIPFGEPVELFNGVDLTGWTLTNPEAANGWIVEDGALTNNPVEVPGQPDLKYGNLRTVDTFEDFNLSLEVNIPAGSNSGVYLRGLYEVQIDDTYGEPLDPHNMGAIYSRITPLVAAEKPAGEWQTLDMTLVDRHVTVILNGVTIIDNQPVGGITGGALSADELAPGPVYLQGDHGRVMYRNIVLRNRT